MYDATFYLTIYINNIAHTLKHKICNIEKLNEEQLYFQIGAFIGNVLRKFSPCKYNDIKSFGLSDTKRFDKHISFCSTDQMFCKNSDDAEEFDNNIRRIINKYINFVKNDFEDCKNITKDMINYGILKISSTIEEHNFKL